MKQIKHMILLCLFCLTGIAAQAQTGPASNEIWYTATSQVTPNNILGTGGAGLTADKNEFDESAGCWKITFSGAVITIGENAFYNKALSTITIPASVTSIGKSAFHNCYNSKNTTGLTTVIFAEGSQLGTIGESAFYGCEALSSITIPASVTSIGTSAFQQCKVLSSPITIPASVTSIGKSAFSECSSLATVTFAEGSQLETIGEKVFYGCSALSSITIPASVTSIGTSAFLSCYDSSKETGLTTVTFADGSQLETIGEKVFYGCSALSSITIPASVTSIGMQAFSSCSALESISVDAKNSVYSSPDNCNAIIEKATNKLIQGCKNTVIPESVEIIGDNAFYGISTLGSIAIPANVISIEKKAFSGCSSLTTVTFAEGSKLGTIGGQAFLSCEVLSSITIPASVTSIENSAFQSCSNLTTVIFAEGSQLGTIGQQAFFKCIVLSSITIPASVTKIDIGAFAYCSGIKSVTVNWAEADKIVKISSNVFSNCPEGWTLIVPNGTESLYIADSSWGPYTAYMKFYPVTLHRGLDSNGNYIGYFATFYSSKSAYDLTGTNTKAYKGVLEDKEDESEVKVLKLKDAGNIIGQGMGVVLKCAGEDRGSETIDIVLMLSEKKATDSEEKATDGENILTGTDVELSLEDIPENTYALSKSKKYGVGFYYCNYEGWTIDAHKAYLTLPSSFGAKAFIFQFDDDPTGIKDVQGSKFGVKGSVYNLNGVRVNDNYKGIVIKNGKKFYQK